MNSDRGFDDSRFDAPRFDDPDIGDAAFDRRARDAHRASLDQLEPTTRARLRAARVAAISAEAGPVAWLPAWPLAGAFAAVCVVAVALQLRPDLPAPGPALPQSVVSAADADTTAALDETPDFYLWLASGDAIAAVTE